MHYDARNLDNNSLIEGDICIVGAGAAGISIALDWLNTPHKVILLEGGGFDYDDAVQDLYRGESSGQQYYPLRSSRLHQFGGTTGHWAGMCSPFDPIDFEERDWVPNSGWPITKADLDPYYAKANETLKLGPYNYDLDYWQKELPDMTPFPLNGQVVWNKMWQHSVARFNELYKDTIVQAPNIELYTYANGVDIRANEDVSTIHEVIVKNHAGKMHRVRAKHFILACCAIQNARLLLASRSQAPAGLGNDNDLVGRYFMEHLEIASAELWLLKPFQTNLYTWNLGVTKASAELGITPEAQRAHKILNGTASLMPLAFGRNVDHKIALWKDEDPRNALQNILAAFGQAAEKGQKENVGTITHAFQLNTRIEQAPNPDSRVTLAPEKDALGVPRPHLHWTFTPLDKRSIRTIYPILMTHINGQPIL